MYVHDGNMIDDESYVAVATAYVPSGSGSFNIASSERRTFHSQPFVVDGRPFNRVIDLDPLEDGLEQTARVPFAAEEINGAASDRDAIAADLTLGLTAFLMTEENAVRSAFAREGWTVLGDWKISDLTVVHIDADQDDPAPLPGHPSTTSAVFESTVAITWDRYLDSAFDPNSAQRVLRSGIGADCPDQPDLVVRACAHGAVTREDAPWFTMRDFAGYRDAVGRYWRGEQISPPHDEESGGHPPGEIFRTLEDVSNRIREQAAELADRGCAVTGFLLPDVPSLTIGISGWATREVARKLRMAAGNVLYVDDGLPNAAVPFRSEGTDRPDWVPSPLSDRVLFYAEQEEFGVSAVKSREHARRVRMFLRVPGNSDPVEGLEELLSRAEAALG